jgi:putative addiction module killer protein
MRYQIIKSSVFTEWYEKQSRKTKAIIQARLDRIELDGHLGFTNQFDGLVELKWVSGMRIYTFIHNRLLVVVLCGGNKNGQDKDIKKAKRIKEDYLRKA